MNQKVDIFTKEMELSEDVRDFIDKKISRLFRYLDQIDETRIDLTHSKTAKEEKDRFVAQITLRGRGFILRAEERADNIKSALDTVLDKIERQIERYKGKKYKSHAGAIPASDLLVEEILDETIPLIVRRKKFMLIPMDELEAIDQMNLLGHDDFFIFYNIDTSAINVLYKRRDGSFGIIEPELG
jgi:putative sigma-54 modulation protein